MDATAWATLSLGLFLGLVWRMGAFKALAANLDKRAAEIAQQLADAKRLRSEAEALLQHYQGRAAQAESEARALLAEARADASALRQDLRAQLDRDLLRREQQAQERISRAEAQASAEIRGIAAKAAIEAAEGILRSRMDSALQADLVAAGIGQMQRLLIKA